MVTFIDRLGAQLQTIERGVSRQSFALIAFQYPILSEWIALAGDQAMDGIKPQMVMIIEIFVAKHQAMNPLADKFLNAVFDITLVTVIDEASRKNPVTTRCGAPVRAILTHPHRWRGNHLRNLPLLFGYLSLEITRIVLYSLSSKRRPFCKV